MFLSKVSFYNLLSEWAFTVELIILHITRLHYTRKYLKYDKKNDITQKIILTRYRYINILKLYY